MKHMIGLALVMSLILGLSGCTLPSTLAPTPFPGISSKAPPINTLSPLPTFTNAVTQAVKVTASTASTQPVPKPTQAAPTQPAKVQPTPTQPAPTQPPATLATATKAAPTPKDVKAFLVALNDNGVSGKKIGCGDSVVGVIIQVPDPAAPLRGALDKLLAAHTQYYGQSGLFNALFRSDLMLEMVTISSGVAEIKLTGAMTIGGVCDAPRVQAQLEETALQFSTVQKVNILVNGIRLQDLLSSK